MTLIDDTYVHVFADSSIAFDAAVGSSLTVDQRGVTRDGTPDIGAYEHDGSPYAIDVTASSGGGLSINADGGNDAYLVADDGGAILGGLTQMTLKPRFQQRRREQRLSYPMALVRTTTRLSWN